MNFQESKQLIDEFTMFKFRLRELENAAQRYRIQSVPHNLDKKVLFEIELLHEKIGSILMNLYMGDLEEIFHKGALDEEEYSEIIKSPFAKYRYMSSSFLYNEKLYDKFSVKGKEFSFNLDKESCYFIGNGICSLEVNEKDINGTLKKEFKENDSYIDNFEEFLEYASGNEGSILYCRSLADSIKKEGFKSPVFINYHKCNHYSFEDGQHRSCIASKLNIPIPAYISDMTSEDYLCSYCCNKQKTEALKQIQQSKLQNDLTSILKQKLLTKLKIKARSTNSISAPPKDCCSVILRKL